METGVLIISSALCLIGLVKKSQEQHSSSNSQLGTGFCILGLIGGLVGGYLVCSPKIDAINRVIEENNSKVENSKPPQ